MILDQELIFSDAQAVTAAAGSTNTIDLSAVRNVGDGTELYVFVVVDVAMTDAGSDSTIAVALEGDSTTTITPDATRDLFTIPALTAAGTVFYARLAPGGGPEALRYVRLKYTPANGSLSTGSFTAGLVTSIQRVPHYADAITIQ